MLIKLETDHRPSHLAVVFDAGAHSFRNELYTEYKANRVEPPDDLKPQFGLVRKVVETFNIPVLEAVGFEADDLDRHAGPPGAAARAARRGGVLGQGPHAAGRRRAGHAPRHHEERAARLHLRRKGGRGEVRRPAGQARRRAGAHGRLGRQRARRARRGAQDRGGADPGLRLGGEPARRTPTRSPRCPACAAPRASPRRSRRTSRRCGCRASWCRSTTRWRCRWSSRRSGGESPTWRGWRRCCASWSSSACSSGSSRSRTSRRR